MLFTSTETLLRSILQALQVPDHAGWDDQLESGKECLYEMHQMTRPDYRGYRTAAADKWPAQAPNGAALVRAMPHVKLMVQAIRRQDQANAVQSGQAALAEMYGGRGSRQPVKTAAAPAPVAAGLRRARA